MKHLCEKTFPTFQIDNCSGIGIDKCHGDNPMILEIWFEDRDGTGCYCDNWIKRQVNFCPMCGYEAKKKISDNEEIEER